MVEAGLLLILGVVAVLALLSRAHWKDKAENSQETAGRMESDLAAAKRENLALAGMLTNNADKPKPETADNHKSRVQARRVSWPTLRNQLENPEEKLDAAR